MAIPKNPKFGSGFNPAKFREAIKSTLEMAAPNATADKAIFKWESVRTFDSNTPVDSSGTPFMMQAEVASVSTHEDVQINVAVELVEKAPYGSALGQIDSPRVVLTVLDEDYALIVGANKVLLGANQYEIDFWAPPIGLFGVDIHTAYAHATDET